MTIIFYYTLLKVFAVVAHEELPQEDGLMVEWHLLRLSSVKEERMPSSGVDATVCRRCLRSPLNLDGRQTSETMATAERMLPPLLLLLASSIVVVKVQADTLYSGSL